MRQNLQAIFTIILIIGCCRILNAQLKLQFDSSGHKIVYTEVVDGKGMNNHQLYKASIDWVIFNYYPDDAIVQVNDSVGAHYRAICSFKDSFKFMEQHVSSEPNVYYYLAPTNVTYALDIEIKGGKCILSLSELHFKYILPQNSFANSSDTAVVASNSFENQYNLVLTKMTSRSRQKKSWLAFFKSCDYRLKSVLLSYKKHIRNARFDSGNAF